MFWFVNFTCNLKHKYLSSDYYRAFSHECSSQKTTIYKTKTTKKAQNQRLCIFRSITTVHFRFYVPCTPNRRKRIEWRFPRLKRKDKYYRLLRLTAEAEWVDFPEIVKEVQKIGATISDGRASPMNYQDVNGIKVIDQESNVRKYATINECVITEQNFGE